MLALLLLTLIPAAFAADTGLLAITSTAAAGGGQTYSLSLQTLLLLTSLSFLACRAAVDDRFYPHHHCAVSVALGRRHAVLTAQSGIDRAGPVSDVFCHVARAGQDVPRAYLPYSEDKITLEQAYEKGSIPLKAFMLRQTRETDLALFVKIANSEPLQSADQVPLRILVPAYVTSELKTAFQIGFVVFIPFLIIDMVVASVLMSMGMMMVSPSVISLPFKIMLFVLADGWNLLIGSLVQSFYT